MAASVDRTDGGMGIVGMSFDAFMNDPKGYLKVHAMQLIGGAANLVPAAMTRAAAVANPANGNSIQFTHNANVTMSQSQALGPTNFGAQAVGQVGLMNKRFVIYGAAVGGPYPNLRILPWSGGDVSFMQLGGGADFALTGPLTGCTVAVVRHAGALWFFHANVAGGGGMGSTNRATKRQMIFNAGAIVGIPKYADYMYCQFGADHQYHGLAFVWGRLHAGGTWKFYVHEIQPPGGFLNVRTTESGKWADI